MCGDICCPSCGPAQGNSRCQICRAWASDGCIHFDEETNNYKKEYLPQLEAIQKAEYEAENKVFEEYEKEKREGLI